MIAEAEARAALRRLLEEQSTLVLSTAGGDGPGATPLFYVVDGAEALCWLSSPTSRHSLQLERDPRAAVAIHAPTFRWDEIRGAQLRGEVAVVEREDERTRILAAYRVRFELGDAFDAAIGRSRLYRFVPRWGRYLDNRLGFGGRVELALDR